MFPYAFDADIIDTKYETARRSTTMPTIAILWKKYRETYKNLRAIGHHPSSRSHKGKVFRVNEFLSRSVSGEMRGKFLRVNRSLSWTHEGDVETEKETRIFLLCAIANNAGCITSENEIVCYR